MFTKTQIIVPNGWEHLSLLTSRSHLLRTLKIFQHVMGRDFNVQGVLAPEQITVKERAYELMGAIIMKEVLRGTKPGDDEAVYERLCNLVPGYGQSTPIRLAAKSLLGIIKAR